MLYNVSMLKCGDNRLCCAGKRPPPRYSFSPLCAPHPACGESHNHSLFFPFSPREGWSDGAYAAASLSHAMQLICNLSPLFSPTSDSYPLLLFSFFLSFFLVHASIKPRRQGPMPPAHSAAVPKSRAIMDHWQALEKENRNIGFTHRMQHWLINSPAGCSTRCLFVVVVVVFNFPMQKILYVGGFHTKSVFITGVTFCSSLFVDS